MLVILYCVRCSACGRWLSEAGPVLTGELAVPCNYASVDAAVDAGVDAGWRLAGDRGRGVTDLYCPVCVSDGQVP
jgi:hypothetical protein